jgi:SNF2 family DNA or RNA helicase
MKEIPSTKLKAIIDDIKSIDKNDKIVVFSSFKTAIDILGKKIEEEVFNEVDESDEEESEKKYESDDEDACEDSKETKKDIKESKRKCFYISGIMSIQKRSSTIHKFEESKNGSILLITLKTGSEGIELTCANHIIFIEDWWNPATIVQSISRSKRFGQKKKVHWYTYIMKGTVEERIQAVAQRKQKMIEKVLRRAKSESNKDEKTPKSIDKNSYNMKDEDINFILDKKTIVTVKNDVEKISQIFCKREVKFEDLLMNL